MDSNGVAIRESVHLSQMCFVLFYPCYTCMLDAVQNVLLIVIMLVKLWFKCLSCHQSDTLQLWKLTQPVYVFQALKKDEKLQKNDMAMQTEKDKVHSDHVQKIVRRMNLFIHYLGCSMFK